MIKRTKGGGQRSTASSDDTRSGIGERIRSVRGAFSRDTFADTVGVSRNTLLRYEQEERRPDADFLQRVCERHGVDPTWLLLGTSASRSPDVPPAEGFAGEYALVPLYDVEVSAGYGALAEQERSQSRLAFRRDWLSEMGLYPDNVVTVLARGDSMEPTLHDGDLLLVDTAQRQVVKDAVYVIRQEGLLYVKRLQRLYDGSLRISSDNPAYAVEVVPKKDLGFLEIIGRVVWSGGRL